MPYVTAGFYRSLAGPLAYLALMALCTVQIELHNGTISRDQRNIVMPSSSTRIADGSRMMASIAELETGMFIPISHDLPMALMTTKQLCDYMANCE